MKCETQLGKYDVQDDVLYNAWSKQKQKALSHLPNSDKEAAKDVNPSNPIPEIASLTISPAAENVLQYPDPVPTCGESDSDSDVSSRVIRPQCGQFDQEDSVWVQCDHPDCQVWQNVECTDINPKEI